MFSSFVRVNAVICLAFSCGAAQAGLVVFDSTDGLNTSTLIDTRNNNAYRLNQDAGVTFRVNDGANISLQSATFGVFRATDALIDFQISLHEGNSTANVLRGLSVPAVNVLSGRSVFTFNTGGWNLNAGSTYTVALGVAGTQNTTTWIGGTGVPQGEFTQAGLPSTSFIRGPTSPSDPYWIQLNADPAVVPEPATIGLLFGGLGIGLGRRIRRRSRKASTGGGAAKSAAAFGDPLRRLKAAFSR